MEKITTKSKSFKKAQQVIGNVVKEYGDSSKLNIMKKVKKTER